MKILGFFFILIMANPLLYAQSEIMRFLSKGFNTVHYQRDDKSAGRDYFFYGHEDYSEALIFRDRVELRIGEATFYPYGLIRYEFPPRQYERYSGQNNSIGYNWDVPTSGRHCREHKYENGRLVYWAVTYGDGIPYATAERIEQNDKNIIIYSKINEINSQYTYYNISQTELLDMFLKKYVELIFAINEMVNKNISRDRLYEVINPVFHGRTARELAIFRNCLFAIKGYRFATQTWTDFFNKYLEGYNGRYSNNEVLAMFTEGEQWLLDLVIRYENRR